MKLIKKTESYVLLFLAALFLVTSCQKDDDFQDDPQLANGNVDANKITQSLKFRNGTVITGDIPKSVNSKNATAVADLKIDTDTIFWVKGVINRIKILKPENPSTFSSHFWVQVENSNSYIEAEFEVEQENDTLVFLNFDFDVTEWEPPLSFNLKIVPKDDTDGSPLDEFNLPVVIEEPITGSCNFNITEQLWEWISTVDESIPFFAAPMYPFIEPSTTLGCCINGNSSTGSCGSTNERILDYENTYIIKREFFKLFTITNGVGEVGGVLDTYARNLDPSASNYCSNSAGYIESNFNGTMAGDYTTNPGNCTITFDMKGGANTTFMGDDRFFATYTLLSKHFIKETRSGNPEGEGGNTLERLYVRRTLFLRWFD